MLPQESLPAEEDGAVLLPQESLPAEEGGAVLPQESPPPPRGLHVLPCGCHGTNGRAQPISNTYG